MDTKNKYSKDKTDKLESENNQDKFLDLNNFNNHVVGINKSNSEDMEKIDEIDLDTEPLKEDKSIINNIKKFIKHQNDEDESEDETDLDLIDEKDHKKNKKVSSKRARNSIILLIVISFSILIIAFVLLGLNEVFSCFKLDNKSVTVEIPSGAPISVVSNILNESGVIDYPWMFSTYVSIKGNSLKYGKFKLNTSMNYDTIYNILSDSSLNISKMDLVITEGMNMFNILEKNSDDMTITGKDIINELNNKENYSKYNFSKYISDSEISNAYYPMEGFCAPYTFFIDSSSNAKALANAILKKTEDNLSPLYQDIKNSKMSLWQIMTIASMIQAETHKESEMANISSVIYNRLNNQSEFPKLQCDPTYRYATRIKDNIM
ncbi:MAG: endolytic transglycosylase MltG, partial [Oscillospiraceae bacterium]|nr:endolytic transglycosylase MltG [Oscillospiraceae bacterium]